MSEIGRTHRDRAVRRIPSWGIPAAVLVFVTAVVVVESYLDDYVHDRLRAQIILYSIGEGAAEQEISLYEAINRGELIPEIGGDLKENRREMQGALDELQALNPGDEGMARLGEALGAYRAAVDKELDLIEAGRLERAEVVDEERLDPGFEALQDILQDEGARYEAEARRAGLVVDVATYGIALLAAITLVSAALSWQRLQKRRSEQEALQRSEERFRSLVQNSSDVVTVVDAGGNILYQSPSIKKVLGYDPEERIGEKVDDASVVHPDDVAAQNTAVAGAVANPGESATAEVRVRHRDGSWRHMEVSYTSLLDDPRVGGIVLNARDVTERKRAGEELRRSERFLAEAQRIARVGSWEYEADPGEARWSDELYRILGVDPGQCEPTRETFLNFVHPEDRPLVENSSRVASDRRGRSSLEFRVVPADGRARVVQNHHEVVFDSEEAARPSRVTGTVQDITERKALEERLEHQALHDPLTGLPNRALLMDRLSRALLKRAGRRGAAGSVAVLFVDLDNFKYVNDSLGHEAGDRLLAAVSARLRDCVRPGDTVARFGGDEFVVLLEGIGEANEAARVAERIKGELLRAPFPLDEAGREAFVTPSIGIAFGGPGEAASPEDLLRRADAAMYGAKAAGKNRHVAFDPAMNDRAAGRLEMESDLRRALGRGELRVRYQPQVSLKSGEVVGFEALVRWEHPRRGLVPPSKFVPLAEEIGLIAPIGLWVLKEACRRARGWHDERHPSKPPLGMSVNLSVKQLNQRDLAGEVAEVLRGSGLRAGILRLEVTESAVMEDASSSIDALRRLKNLGVGIDVDDFGKGYSSLGYLKRLPADRLKIDRSFVEGLGEDAEDEKLVSGVIGLARSLGLGTVAEGVETEGQLAKLKELGCDLAQGYYFAEPLTGEAAGKLLEGDAPR